MLLAVAAVAAVGAVVAAVVAVDCGSTATAVAVATAIDDGAVGAGCCADEGVVVDGDAAAGVVGEATLPTNESERSVAVV